MRQTSSYPSDLTDGQWQVIAPLCAASFDAAWERVIPHQAYQPA